MKIQSYQNPKDGRYYFHITDTDSSRQIFTSVGFDSLADCEAAQKAFALKHTGDYKITQSYTKSGQCYFELLDKSGASLGRSLAFAGSQNLDTVLSRLRSTTENDAEAKSNGSIWKVLGAACFLAFLGIIALAMLRSGNATSEGHASAVEKQSTTELQSQETAREPIAAKTIQTALASGGAIAKAKQTEESLKREALLKATFVELGESNFGEVDLKRDWEKQDFNAQMKKGSIAALEVGKLNLKDKDGKDTGLIDCTNRSMILKNKEIRDTYGVRINMPYKLVNIIREGMSIDTNNKGQTLMTSAGSNISYLLGQNLDQSAIEGAKVQAILWN